MDGRSKAQIVSAICSTPASRTAKDWGAGAAGAPVMSTPYWFFVPEERSWVKGLPPMLVFLVAVTNWSDGTPAARHNE